MTSKIVIPFITFVLGALAVLGYQYYGSKLSMPLFTTPGLTNPVACTMEAKICPDGTSVGRTGPDCAFAECPASAAVNSGAQTNADAIAWRFEDAGTTENGAVPHTEVFATIRGTEYSLGVYVGGCAENKITTDTPAGASNEKLPQQTGSVICWFGGGGNEIATFTDGNDIVVSVGDVDEGTSEIKGFRGNFKQLLRVLPAM